MDARRQLVAAARALDPLRQGELDGLCGIYALINWIQLGQYARVQFTPGERKWLFEHGVEFLAQTRHLPDIVTSGMSSVLWKRLARSMLAEAASLSGIALHADPVIKRPKPTALQLQRAITSRIDLGQPVILTLWGRYNHTTVVYDYSDHRLRLFDSYGFKWITLRSIEPYQRHGHGRHMIRPASTFSLRWDWRGR